MSIVDVGTGQGVFNLTGLVQKFVHAFVGIISVISDIKVTVKADIVPVDRLSSFYCLLNLLILILFRPEK